ncbi:hypothetical protein EV672_103349 [Aquabacterium commune]|uniref:Uncharacterized protein n=1 Tax=Aquabacterium commune TaxID=70586 RepID=A0A4R6RFA8_9BURK|nr:hypothetical protein [Aquabacterium commune]TDP84775.1 hypothetical protein EV672_103349 [Aquabacterium commune]
MTNASNTFDSGSVYALLNSADEAISYLSPHDEYVTDRVMNALENRMNDHQGIPREVPMAQAGARFFALLDNATADMKGRFSPADFTLLLNSECSPIWNWEPSRSLAGQVADDHGVDDLNDLDTDCPVRILIERLMTLSPLENAVLVDACEQVWRGHPNPLL